MNEKGKTKHWILSNIFPIISAIVVILNLWLFTKLSPIVADIKSLVVRVDAQGEQFESHKEISTNTFGRIDSSLTTIIDKIDGINTRLSRIEGKLEK